MTWLDLPPDTGFGLDNLPLGIFSTPGGGPRRGVRIGDLVLDLWAYGHDPDHATGSLNALLARGPERWAELRLDLRNVLTDEASRAAVEPFLVPLRDVDMHLPFEVADYVDFYREPLTLADGSTRTFLADGDVVTISATAPGVGGARISLGEVTGRVEPAR